MAAITAGCLPRGEPPGGRQLVADRQAVLGGIVPPTGDGVLRVLFLRPAADGQSRELFVAALDGAGRQSEALLLSDLAPDEDLGCGNRIGPCARVDPTGHVWLYPQSGGLVRVDPVTGERLKWNDAIATRSDSGQRFFVKTTSAETATLYGPDGQTLPVWPGQFVGDDLYSVTPDGALIHVPPSGPPEQLATGLAVTAPPSPFPHPPFWAFPTSAGTLLILTRPTSDPGVLQTSVRDPATGQETVVPLDDVTSFSPSPDGRWLLLTEPGLGAEPVTLLDCRTGATERLDQPFVGLPSWRQGHDPELWGTLGPEDAPSVWVHQPGGPTITVPGAAEPYVLPGANAWLSQTDLTSPPMEQIGMADDPTGPRYALNSTGSTFDQNDIWPLADGRVLTASFAKDEDRADFTATDPRTGDSRVLAQRGRMAAIGRTRFVGMFDFIEARGDLTSVDIQSGERTVLAPEFALGAFAEPQGDDPVAPATWVAYQFQARTASPDDGIWVVAIP